METRHFYFWPNSDKRRNTLIHLYQLKCKTRRDAQTLRMYPHFWPRLVFVGVSGMWIHLYIWMYPHIWPRLVFIRISGMWIHLYIRMYPHVWPRMVFVRVSGIWIHLYIRMYPHFGTDWYLLGLAECRYISIYGCIHIYGQGWYS